METTANKHEATRFDLQETIRPSGLFAAMSLKGVNGSNQNLAPHIAQKNTQGQ